MSLHQSRNFAGHGASVDLKPEAGKDLLLRKLLLRSTLSAEEQAAIRSLPTETASLRAKQDLVAEGSAITKACLLIEGVAGRQKLLPDGSRQIVAVYLPGDVLELCTPALPGADCTVAALSPCKAASIPHTALRAVADAHPAIAQAFLRETLVDGAILREWLLNVGRRDAYSRLAHLFCEIIVRLEAIGICADDRFELPVTQHDLADATGLTSVHVNRTMQKLRADGLIATHGSTLYLRDWNKLAFAANFDPTYLYLPGVAHQLH